MEFNKNIVNKRFSIKSLSIALAIACVGSLPVKAEGLISKTQVIEDITYLASDDLKGRGNFTDGLKQAAKYIGQRFNEVGLQGLNKSNDSSNGYQQYLQQFNVTQIIPTSLTASINGHEITQDNLAIASTMATLNWQNSADIKTHIVGENDNMRAVLHKINDQGGQHLVLINSAHKKLFKGYQGYFKRGLTKLSLKEQGAIVIALSDATKIDNINVQATNTIETKSLSNVVGVLPGKAKGNEFILYSAHYDHLGVDENGQAIYNGADDDASGTTAIINLAQYYAKKGNNQRTIIFSAFAAEEIGGFGSRFFSKQLNPDDVVAMINIEMIGKPSKFGKGTVWMTGMDRSNLGQLLNDKLKPLNREIYQDPYPKQDLFYRSDNATLARLGVPAHSFSSTQLDKDQHYHQTTDDINSLDLDSMHLVIESLATATESLVTGEVTPSRVDTKTIRANGKIF